MTRLLLGFIVIEKTVTSAPGFQGSSEPSAAENAANRERATPFAAVNPSFAFFDTVEVAAGESLSLRYRLVVATGEWDREHLESYVEAHPW